MVEYRPNPELVNAYRYMSLNERAGALIRHLRIKNSMSGKTLAGFVGVSQQQISRYETGECELTLRQVEKIAFFLGFSFWQFVDELYHHNAKGNNKN